MLEGNCCTYQAFFNPPTRSNFVSATHLSALFTSLVATLKKVVTCIDVVGIYISCIALSLHLSLACLSWPSRNKCLLPNLPKTEHIHYGALW